MNGHLSSERFSEWTLGERNAETARHLEACSACRAELDRCQDALMEFRGAVHELAAAKFSAGFQTAASLPASRSWLTLNRLSGAFGAIALCAILGVSTLHRQAASSVSRASGNGAITDAVLLARIDTELSRAVPCPMEPLTQLVDWQTATK